MRRFLIGGLAGSVAGLAGSQAAFRAIIFPVTNPSAVDWPGWIGAAAGGAVLGGISATFTSTDHGAALVGGFSGLGGGLLGAGIGGRVYLASLGGGS